MSRPNTNPVVVDGRYAVERLRQIQTELVGIMRDLDAEDGLTDEFASCVPMAIDLIEFAARAEEAYYANTEGRDDA